MGLFGMTAGEEYGGTNMGYLAHIVALEEISAPRLRLACPTAPIQLQQSTRSAATATKPRSQKYLPADFRRARRRAGHVRAECRFRRRVDEAARRQEGRPLRAERRQDVDHQRRRRRHAGRSAKTDRDAGAEGHDRLHRREGLQGFTHGTHLDKLGMRGSNTFRCSSTTAKSGENVLGGVGNGTKVLMSGLDYERAVLCGGPLGIMAACMDVVVPYLHERKQFGQPIGEFQLMQGKVADMYSTWQAPRAYVYAVGRACDATDHARTCAKDAAGAILYSAEKATWMAGEAIQRSAASVTPTNIRPGRLWRDAKLAEIGAGTSEIRRMLIGRELMAETAG